MKQKLNQVFFILMIIFSFNFVYAGNGIQINSSDKGNSVSIGSDINITNGRANGSAYINASEFKAKIEENIQERERLREELKENVRGRNELKNEIRATIKDRIMKMGIPRVRVIVNNKNILFEKGENNSIYLRIGNFSAKTKLNISENLDENNRSELKVKLSSGRNAEIKIMPDTAAERALERLRLKVCNKSNNCSIELK